jgi:tetratricopeptide (TPR) repeat protein
MESINRQVINIKTIGMKSVRLMILLTIAFLMFGTLAQTKATENPSKSHPTRELNAVKADIAEMLKDKVEIFEKKSQLTIAPKEVMVLDDKIVLTAKKQEMVINFTDFVEDAIPAPSYRKTKIILPLEKFEFITNGWVTSNLKRLEELRQNLLFIQNQTRKKRYESQLILFKPIAAQYCALKVKPPISEGQRKFIVQANSFNEKKIYDKAIDLYNKAIEVDQTAYPAGYSNLALLSAQINNYDAAIFYMKKYLLLEPESSDARSAQDKIYEWEAQIAK